MSQLHYRMRKQNERNHGHVHVVSRRFSQPKDKTICTTCITRESGWPIPVHYWPILPPRMYRSLRCVLVLVTRSSRAVLLYLPPFVLASLTPARSTLFPRLARATACSPPRPATSESMQRVQTAALASSSTRGHAVAFDACCVMCRTPP